MTLVSGLRGRNGSGADAMSYAAPFRSTRQDRVDLTAMAGAPPPGAVLQGSGERVHCPQPRPGLHNADGLRASQVQHAVEHMDGDVHLGGPTLICVGA